MTQGRKSRWSVRALLCALAALTAALAIPAAAGAAPATEEYELALPQADGGSDDESAAAVAPAGGPPTAPAPEAVVQAPIAAERGSSKKGAGTDEFGAAANDRSIPDLSSTGSGEGGVPALLILLAVIAATSAAFAVWRLRRSAPAPR